MQARNKQWLKYEQDFGNESSLERLCDMCERLLDCYYSGKTDAMHLFNTDKADVKVDFYWQCQLEGFFLVVQDMQNIIIIIVWQEILRQ